MKNIFKKLFNLTCALAMTAYMFSPLTVLATDSIVLTFTIENTAAFPSMEAGSGENTDKGPLTIHDGKNGTGSFRVMSGEADITNEVTYECNSQVSCTITVANRDSVRLEYPTDWMNVTIGENLVEANTSITESSTLVIKELPNQGGNPDEGHNPPSGPPFDGSAVAVWSCGDEICYHVFTSLSNSEVNYIKATDVSDDRNPSKKFDVHAKNKFFAVKEVFDQRKAEIDNNTVKIEDLIGPDGIDYMPVGEPIENNALVAYGNREFKAIIYGDDFKGVSIGDLSELDYYPRNWNDWFLRRETYDMGGTTKDNPVEIDTVLLQKKINLKLQTNLNNYTVTKIEALDVPDDAVTITKKSNGSYDFEFTSNYYDKVVFKITTSDNKEQYIYINRRTTDPWIRTDNGKEGIVVETFFDRNKTYKDLDVIAKIVYKDGSSKVVHLDAEKGLDDGLGNYIDDYEVDEQTSGDASQPKGKGMKRANFVYSMSKADLKKVENIYINVEFKGSTSTVFAGNFVGSGKGDVIEMKYWEDRLN
ncbi:MAG: hypothetical protein IKP76_03020 [Bacilli bacterium]|nr:hypothetical protein [Bacilli bacterium]